MGKNIDLMHKHWGIDSNHNCHDCMNHVKVQRGKRNVYKCLCYGVTDGEETDWKSYDLACGHYHFLFRPKLEQCAMIFSQDSTDEKRQEMQVEGQREITDYIKEGNLSWETGED